MSNWLSKLSLKPDISPAPQYPKFVQYDRGKSPLILSPLGLTPLTLSLWLSMPPTPHPPYSGVLDPALLLHSLIKLMQFFMKTTQCIVIFFAKSALSTVNNASAQAGSLHMPKVFFQDKVNNNTCYIQSDYLCDARLTN